MWISAVRISLRADGGYGTVVGLGRVAASNGTDQTDFAVADIGERQPATVPGGICDLAGKVHAAWRNCQNLRHGKGRQTAADQRCR